jgi:integrase
MERRRRSPQTIRLRLHYLRRFAAWYGDDLATADHDDLQGYIDSDPDWKPATRQSVRASLCAFYWWAHREGLISTNPARDLPSIIVPHRPKRIASEAAIRNAIQCDGISDRAMILLGAECGLRVTEIATLHIEDRDGDWLHVTGKGGRTRSLYLTPELAELLDQIERTLMRHGWYFPGRSGILPIHPSTAWRHITTVLASNPHSLRRRAGTIVYKQSGNDIRLAQVFLGHARSSTTEDYLEIGNGDLARAASLTRVA